MKFNVNVFVGLAFCVVVLGFFGVFQRVLEIRETWRSDDVYTVARRSTYSVVSSSASWRASDGLATPAVSARSANSMFRHRPAFSYAPASTPAYNLSPIAGTASYSSAGASALYTTSSAEFRPFGGGGNAGGASMSGGAVSASSSSAVLGTAVSGIAMSSTSALAYNDNRRATSSIGVGMQSFSGEIALASASTYAGIGNTTAGGPMGVQGRRNVPGIGNNYEGWLTSDFWDYGDGSHDLTMQDLKDLYAAMTGDTDFSNTQEWEAFLAWFEGKQTDENFGWYWQPVSDAIPFVLLLCLMYALVVYRKTKLAKKAEN